MDFGAVFKWFAGDGRYMPLDHCMGYDYFWIAVTVILDLAVASGYVLIARHWWENERHLSSTPAKSALTNMRNIFVFCGICGYLFIPIKMVWPAWRLYDLVMVVLVYFTWRYAWNAGNLKVVYAELGRNAELTAELKKSQEESRRKSFFLNAISHDLRTPLNALVLQADVAAVGASTLDSETVKGAAGEIKTSARAATDLLERLLEYARLEWAEDPNRIEPVNLTALLKRIVTSFGPAASDKGLYLRAAAAPSELIVATDPIKLERIINNLVANAVKFTSAGGVRLELERLSHAVHVHVIDTGVGIAMADQERLFDEFYQVYNGERDRTKGFGLGLTIARRLARQLGGDVQVNSSLGSGSRFSLSLPVSALMTRSASRVSSPPGVPVTA